MHTGENFLTLTESISGPVMQNELSDRFPKIGLEAQQLPTGEWIIAGPIKPLTEDEAKKVISAYQTIQELIGRGMTPD